jgi:hypothetical protein
MFQCVNLRPLAADNLNQPQSNPCLTGDEQSGTGTLVFPCQCYAISALYIHHRHCTLASGRVVT